MHSPPSDYFVFFDLPRQLAIERKDLEKRFYALSRQWHPDLFARAGAEERQHALDGTAILNDAYRTLKDPVARALYVLRLEGFDIGEQGTRDVPPELLEEVFELNMALEELRSGDDDASAQIAAARARFEDMRGPIDTRMEQLFAAWDAKHDRETLAALRTLLNRRKYVANLIEKTNVSDRV